MVFDILVDRKTAEKVTHGLVMLNPVDLGRILMLMQLDISALMGYTGAFFQQFDGNLGSWWCLVYLGALAKSACDAGI